jgi:hypothetical protein
MEDLTDALALGRHLSHDGTASGREPSSPLRNSAACQFARFEAGIAVAEGTEVLAKFKDSNGGGPFVYRPTARGSTLQSRITDEGAKPLSLTFGTNTGKRD